MAAPGTWLSRLVEGYAGILRSPNLLRSQLAWAAAVTAEWAFFVGVGVFAFEQGGAVAVGVVGLVRMLPSAVVGPFASTLGDRYRRDRVVLGLFVAMGAALAIAALALLGDPPSPLIYALAGVQATAATLSRPAQWALLPSLCRAPEELVAAGSATMTTESIGTLAGPVVAGLLLAGTDVESLFGVCAAMYVSAALVVALIRVEAADAPVARAAANLVAELTAGFRAVWRARGAALVIALFCAQSFVRGALNVFLVVVSFDLLDLGESGVGFLTAALGAGGLAGALASVGLGRSRLAAPFAAGLVLWGVPLAITGAWPSTAVALVMVAVIGAGNSVLDVAGLTLLQRLVPNDVRARVLGVLWGLAMATVGIGSIAAAGIVDALDVRAALVVVGLSLPALTAFAWRRLSRIARSVAIPADELAAIELVPMLAQLSLVAKEELAAALEPVELGAGAEVIREGEPGDRFYILVEGETEVYAGSRSIATRVAPDFFGEIALLEDVPRTATVRASSPVRLYALERDAFIAAVTGHAAGREAGRLVVSERLVAT